MFYFFQKKKEKKKLRSSAVLKDAHQSPASLLRRVQVKEREYKFSMVGKSERVVECIMVNKRKKSHSKREKLLALQRLRMVSENFK